MNKVERVARAICQQAALDGGYSEIVAPEMAENLWPTFEKQAKAALAAIAEDSEPTPEMIEEIGRAVMQEVVRPSPGAIKRYGRAAYTAMHRVSLLGKDQAE